MKRFEWIPKTRAGWVQALNIAAAIAAILAVPALVISIITLRDTWRIAEQSGAFDKPSIRFGFGAIESDSDQPSFVGLIPKRCQIRPILMELPLMIFNSGRKPATNVSITLRFHLKDGSSPAPGTMASDLFVLDQPAFKDLKREVYDVSEWRYVSYRIARLLPGMKIQIGEVIQAPLPLTVDLHEADPRLTGAIKMAYSMEVPIIIVHDEAIALSGKLNVSAVQADTIQEAGPSLKDHVDALAKQTGTKLTGLRKIVAPLMPAVKGRIFLAQSTSDSCQDRDGSLAYTRRVGLLEYQRAPR